MKQQRQTRVALITGASGGMGQAIARRLHHEGLRVAVHYHQAQEKAQHLVEELSVNNAAKFQADLRQETEVKAMIASCVRHFGRLDILINNAGWTRYVPDHELEGLDNDLVQRTLELKVHAPLYCIRAARPYLAAHGTGSVVNITSVAGLAAKGSSIIYAAANAALSNLTRSMARALAPDIRVNAVAPGFVSTGWLWTQDPKAQQRVAENNYIQRVITPEEVAAAVYFLCAESPGITGEELVIDGGIGRLGVKPRPYQS